jgi:hypothetical protein
VSYKTLKIQTDPDAGVAVFKRSTRYVNMPTCLLDCGTADADGHFLAVFDVDEETCSGYLIETYDPGTMPKFDRTLNTEPH